MGLSEGLMDAVKKYNAVRCDTCGKVLMQDEVHKLRAFSRGWPECHGETMRLHVAEEQR